MFRPDEHGLASDEWADPLSGFARVGLRGRLLALLLAFGVLPLVASIVAGVALGRAIVSRQARDALGVLTGAQAIHLAMELDRERLLLRTIAGQLPGPASLEVTDPQTLARLLIHSLPEGGVFDGLRIVAAGGRVLASVALRNTAPHWPPEAPAADWARDRVVVHRDGEQALAYLVAVSLAGAAEGPWLEGHVRAEDFGRVFSIPEHLMPGAESFVLERGAGPVFMAGGAGDAAVLRLAPSEQLNASRPISTTTESAVVATAPVAGADWLFVSVLPSDIALAPFDRLRNGALVGTGALVLLLVVTGALAAGSVTTPLRRLAAAAERFGQTGRYDPVATPAAGEVGVLVESFDTMADGLARSRAEVDALHARDLARAQQLATVGELASGVAHEIRNPLTGVRGALDLAIRTLPEPAEARPLLEEAQAQVERMETTTTQLLRYARPPELRVIETDTAELAERAVTIVAPQAASAGVALRLDSAPWPVRVRVDPEMMVQVLVNLLLNAVDAAGLDGSVDVQLAADGAAALIRVCDTGPGVAEAARESIFRPFFTTKSRGTGLGLSISRQIVTRHGGELTLEDTPGGGATFTVSLPIAVPGRAAG
ncbi:MAG: sensor histidine kinase [Gemmatimonadales bacterium]